MRHKRWGLIGTVVLSLVALGAAAELLLSMGRGARPPVPEDVIPRDVLNPHVPPAPMPAAAVRIMKAQLPLRLGDPAPRISVQDFRNEPIRVPAPDGKPTIVVISDGTLPNAPFLHRLNRLARALDGSIHAVGIVATSSEYQWGHHASSFSLEGKVQLFHDPRHELRARMRPAGNDPARLPLIWACDGTGKIRFVAQPSTAPGSVRPGSEQDWIMEVQRRLGLPPQAVE